MSIPANRTSVFVLVLLLACAAAAQAPPQAAGVEVTDGPTVTYVDDQFAVVAWTTSAPSESRVFYGTDPNDLNQVAESMKETTLHRVDLRGLQPDTTCCVGFSNSSASRTTTASLPWQCDILRAFRAGAAEQFAEAHLGCLDQAQ